MSSNSSSSSSSHHQLQHRTVYLQCPIHQQIKLADYQVDILRSPHFQRLTRLKQLGMSYIVYPGATHTRLEHSLGVAHLARTLIDCLRRAQPDLDIDERDERLIVIAAQLHDLSHGILSHSFESWMHQSHPELHWRHEDAAMLLIDDMVRKGHLPSLRDDPLGVARIGVFIRGLHRDEDIREEVLPKAKRWMVDIVSNGRTGIDVDRMDYLMRDSHHALGSRPSTINFDRILQNARVLGDRQRISFHEKTSFSLYEMFHHRWCLFKEIYSHDKTVSAEVMLADTLTLLDAPLHIAERVRNPDQYLLLSDDVLQVARWQLQQRVSSSATATSTTTTADREPTDNLRRACA